MVAVDSTTGTMMGYHGPHYAIQSFHHSESSLAFNLSDSSDSFVWSDFPVYDEATEPIHTVKSPSRAVLRMEAEDAVLKFEAEEESEPEMDQPTESLILDFSSSWPVAKNHSNKAPSKKSKNRSYHKRSVVAKPKAATKVRFAPTLEVRTHSVVLGDHPWCEDGLALELGWDYEVSRDICQSQQTAKLREPPRWRLLTHHHGNKNKKKVMYSRHPRQRSQQERKRLLLEVGGCSETELELRRFQAKILLELEIRREEERRREERRRRRQKSRSRHARSAPPQENNNNDKNNIPKPCVGSATNTSSLYAAMA